MTKKFDKIIMFGFYSNLIYTLFQVYKVDRHRLKKKSAFSVGVVVLEVLVAAMWMT